MEHSIPHNSKITQYISGGKTRCVQASLRMVLHALTGETISQTKADKLSGYVKGCGTWQFRTLLAFAQYGLHVLDHEAFDAEAFASNPQKTIYEQVGDKVSADAILEETNIPAEVTAVKACLASPNIYFKNSTPSLENLTAELYKRRIVLVNVNLRILQNRAGREGHILILENLEGNNVIVHDPGQDGGLNKSIPIDLFQKAWTSPSKEMANFISIWKDSF